MKTLYFKLTLCFFLLLAGNATQGIWAQQEPIQIAGIVLDEHGDPLPGANISVKGKEKTGTITDMDGNFSMKSLAPKTTLIVSFMGYKSKEIVVAQTDKKMRISLEPDSESLDEVVVVGMGTQRKVSVVGAVTSVNPAVISAPSTSVANMLGGVVPGIIAVDRSGEPGQDVSEFWIRGISTFGANQSALVLIDGIEGNDPFRSGRSNQGNLEKQYDSLLFPPYARISGSIRLCQLGKRSPSGKQYGPSL